MLEIVAFSIITGIFVKGWIGKLLVFPAVIAIYATLRVYFSPKAKIIRENRNLEDRSLGLSNYIIIFAYKFIISVFVAGLTGFLVTMFR